MTYFIHRYHAGENRSLGVLATASDWLSAMKAEDDQRALGIPNPRASQLDLADFNSDDAATDRAKPNASQGAWDWL